VLKVASDNKVTNVSISCARCSARDRLYTCMQSREAKIYRCTFTRNNNDHRAFSRQLMLLQQRDSRTCATTCANERAGERKKTREMDRASSH